MKRETTYLLMIEAARKAAEIGDIAGVLRALDMGNVPSDTRGRPCKYDWTGTPIGGGFAIDGRSMRSVSAQVSRANRIHGVRYKCARDTDGVWVERVA